MAWKQVNFRQELYDEVAALAASQRRSVANMFEQVVLSGLGRSGASAGGFTVSEPRDLAGKVKPDPRRA
jgi:hypothetical protein